MGRCFYFAVILYEKEVSMTFPISIIRIEDRMVLIQGYISNEFKRQLDRVVRPSNMFQIKSSSTPDIGGTIFINGSNINNNYKIVDCRYNETLFNKYQESIKHYKEAMGYEN